MRLVLDTSVLVAAIRSEAGVSRQILKAALDAQFQLLISTPLVLEYEAVLTRKVHLAASGLAVSDVEALIDVLCELGSEVRLARTIRPALKDPDDEMVLETAVNGQADAIVTFNVADFWAVPADFGIEVLTPRQAKNRLGIR